MLLANGQEDALRVSNVAFAYGKHQLFKTCMTMASYHDESWSVRSPNHPWIPQVRASNMLQVDDCRDTGGKQSQADLSLITSRLRELEAEHAEPERREALRRRKKQLKEMAAFVDDKQKSAQDKIAYLVQRAQLQVST